MHLAVEFEHGGGEFVVEACCEFGELVLVNLAPFKAIVALA